MMTTIATTTTALIFLLLVLLGKSSSSSVQAKDPAPVPSQMTYMVSFQYKYYYDSSSSSSSSSNTNPPFNVKQFMSEVFTRVSLSNTTYYLINSRTVVDDGASSTSTSKTSYRDFKYEMQIILRSRHVYDVLLNSTSSLVYNSDSSSSSGMLFLGNTVQVTAVEGVVPAPAVDPIFPKESLGIAVIVTIAIVGIYLLYFAYGLIKNTREDFKTTQEMEDAKMSGGSGSDTKAVSFKPEPIDESQFLNQGDLREHQSTSHFTKYVDNNDDKTNPPLQSINSPQEGAEDL